MQNPSHAEVPLFTTLSCAYPTIFLRFVGGCWGLKPGTVAQCMTS
jgi:hypothetical protein